MEQILGSFRRRIALTAELVAFPHTIFALPFALMGMMLGANGRPGAGRADDSVRPGLSRC